MKPTAPKAAKAIKPKTEEVEEVVVATEASEETAASPVVETADAPRAKVTTTKNHRNDQAGEVNIEQPESASVDVSAIKKDDLVLITMHEDIDPAPRVGNFDCRHRLGVSALRAKKNYRMPKFVAEVIVDAGKGEFLSIEG